TDAGAAGQPRLTGPGTAAASSYVQSPVLGSTVPTTRAGMPTATLRSGMSVVTTAPAPITQWLPIVTPISTTALAPMNVQSPMRTGARSLGTDRSLTQRRTDEWVYTCTPPARSQPRPITSPPDPSIRQNGP